MLEFIKKWLSPSPPQPPHPELLRSLYYEGGGGIALHCPHCEEYYGVIPGFFAEITHFRVINCTKCGEDHWGLDPFGGFNPR